HVRYPFPAFAGNSSLCRDYAFLIQTPGWWFETHTSSDLIELRYQIHAFELKVQVAIAEAFEFEVLRLSDAKGTGIDRIDERSSVGVNGSVAVERVKDIV